MFKLFDGKVRLEVKAASPFDEVFLIDGGYNRVASGIGGLVAQNLDPGLYKLKFKAGNNVVEMSKVLNQEHVEVKGPPIELASPLPPEDLAPTPTLARTPAGRGRRPKGGGGKKSARPVTRSAPPTRVSRRHKAPKTKWSGAGSELSFYVGTQGHKVSADLIDAMSLINDAGEDIKGFAHVNPQALTATLTSAPGFYRLKVQLADLGAIEMPLWAERGFQTCVFLPLREFGVRSHQVRPDLTNAAVTMHKLGAAKPDWQTVRITEQARANLRVGRAALPRDETDRLLIAKWEDPMQGIFGAHLLLLENPVDVPLFSEVTANLQRLAPSHPDVRILNLWSDRLQNHPANPVDLVYPPMLAASWRLLENPWMRERIRIPPDSLAALVATNLWSESVWLLWVSFAWPLRSS